MWLMRWWLTTYISRSLLMRMCSTVHCVRTKEPSLNIWQEFKLTVAQCRWLSTSATLRNQWSARMQAAFRVLINHYHSPYNRQNYGSPQTGNRLVQRTLHAVNLPTTPGQLTPNVFFEDSRDFAEPSFLITYRNVGLSVTINCESHL